MVAHVNRAYQLGGWQSPCSPVLFAQEGITASGIRKSFVRVLCKRKDFVTTVAQWVLQYSSLCWVLVQFSALLVCAALAALINLLTES